VPPSSSASRPSLLAGGVLAQHAAAGAATAVVTATWAPDSHRAGELADALDILGADRHRSIGTFHLPNETSGGEAQRDSGALGEVSVVGAVQGTGDSCDGPRRPPR
jgi:hypothetical protein